MPEAELRAEIDRGHRFLGLTRPKAASWESWAARPLAEVTLIRHAYVRPGVQQQGMGARLLQHLLQGIPAPVLVGTWAAAWWAIRFYEKHGFRLVTPEEKDRLLRRYWTISDRQVETSVVLADPKWLALGLHAASRQALPAQQFHMAS